MEHNDRPWIKEEKSEVQERFELEAEKERLKEENKRKTIRLIIAIVMLLIILSASVYGYIEFVRRIAKS